MWDLVKKCFIGKFRYVKISFVVTVDIIFCRRLRMSILSTYKNYSLVVKDDFERITVGD